MKHSFSPSKVVIVGAGMVGASSAYACMIKGVCKELVLIDVNEEREQGEVMDLVHGSQFVETLHVHGGDYRDCKNADLIVITAGASQKPGETRLDLAAKNAGILRSILKKISPFLARETIILIVSNPVDVLTAVARRFLKRHPQERIIGSGTSLDTSRLRHYLGEHFQVNPRSVHAYIVGEHGDSELCVWSSANIASVPLSQFRGYNKKKMERIFEQTKNAAYEIIKRKGATHFAIGLVVAELAEIILKDQHTVIPLSVCPHGLYGIDHVCFGLPAKLGRAGIEGIIPLKLSASEIKKLRASAKTLKAMLRKISVC
jgi:L-lactate dehydrogenase